MNTSSTPRRIDARFFLYLSLALFVLLSGIAVLTWSQNENPYRTWVLGGVLGMLFCLFVMPLVFGLAHAIICFMLSTIVVCVSIGAAHNNTALSGKDMEDLALSGCVKERVENQIRNHGAVDREGIDMIKELCAFHAQTQTAEYKNKKTLTEQQNASAANAQLQALGVLNH